MDLQTDKKLKGRFEHMALTEFIRGFNKNVCLRLIVRMLKLSEETVLIQPIYFEQKIIRILCLHNLQETK